MTRTPRRSWPTLLIVVGVTIRLLNVAAAFALGTLPPVLSAIDVLAAVAIAIGAVYFLVRALTAMKRRLLWRVRRKLVISYIFIGFVPVILVATFFVVGGVLLLSNFSAYLVHSELRGIAQRAQVAAEDVIDDLERSGGRDAAAVLERRQLGLAKEFPGASLSLVRTGRCGPNAKAAALTADEAPMATAGPWEHVEAPVLVPGWLPCEGFGGLLVYGQQRPTLVPIGLIARGVAFSRTVTSSYAVTVDLVINSTVTQRMRTAVGVAPLDIAQLNPKAPAKRVVGIVAARGTALSRGVLFDGARGLTPLGAADYYDWSTGESGTLRLNISVNLADMYQKVLAGPGQGDIDKMLVFLLQLVGGLFLVIEAFALLVGLTLAKSITGSVHELFTGTERVRRGDFSHKIASTADDQLGELAQSFNSMTGSIEDLLEQAAEKKRLEEELRIAHEIQMSLLPQGPFRMPGISLTALCVPAREVGGDYYDFLPIDDHRLGILIADVSGKGTSAALYMAELKGLVLSLSRIHTSPRALLIDANRIIAKHLDARSFITITYAVLDLKARTMTYARAGHTPLMLLPAGTGTERAKILTPAGMVLGLKIDDGQMFEQMLEEEVVTLQQGDLYLFFTDGITEATNAADDCFGEARLGRFLEEHGHLPTEELRERVVREIGAFVGDAPQHDDMTLILLRVEKADSGVSSAPEPLFAETA